MKSIIDKSIALLKDYRAEHSDFQIENFIIGSQGSEWARYKQALRELSARIDRIQHKAEEIKELSVENKKIIGRDWNPIGRKKRRIKSSIMRSRLKSERCAFRSKMREFVKLYKIAINLKRSIGEVSPGRRYELESEMWVEKARRMAAIDLISINGLQRSTVEFIASFPRELRIEILSDLRPENRARLLSILD